MLIIKFYILLYKNAWVFVFLLKLLASLFDFRDVFISKRHEIMCLYNSVFFSLTENSILLRKPFS